MNDVKEFPKLAIDSPPEASYRVTEQQRTAMLNHAVSGDAASLARLVYVLDRLPRIEEDPDGDRD